jgi:GTPase
MSRSASRLRRYVAEVAVRFQPADLRRFVLAAGDAVGPESEALVGATVLDRYDDLEGAVRLGISDGAGAGAR